MIRRKHTLLALASAVLLTASFGLGHLTTTHAQDAPARPTAREQAPPPLPTDGGPGPLGEHPPHPPRPDDVPGPVKPVDPNAAPTAVKTATDALAGLTAGQVWTHTLPHGEQQLQASIVFQGKEVGRLEFDPATGALLARGQHTPPPPAPDGPTVRRSNRGPGANAIPPVPTDASEAKANAIPAATDPTLPNGAGEPAPSTDAPTTASAAKPAASANLDQIKDQLPDLLRGLSVSQGAEVMPREGCWKVALINGSRVVAELHLSDDGKTVIQDFGATRDAAMFAR